MKNLVEYLFESSSDAIKRLFTNLSTTDSTGLNMNGSDDTGNLDAVAKKLGKQLIHLYCDKMEAEDFTHITIVKDGKEQKVSAEWVVKACEKPTLLAIYIDSASDDVKNALIPLIIDHEFDGDKIEDLSIVVVSENGKIEKDMPKQVVAKLKPIVDLK